MTFMVNQLSFSLKKRITTHIPNLAAPATSNVTFTRLKHNEKGTVFKFLQCGRTNLLNILLLVVCFSVALKKTKNMGP